MKDIFIEFKDFCLIGETIDQSSIFDWKERALYLLEDNEEYKRTQLFLQQMKVARFADLKDFDLWYEKNIDSAE
ncbi:hypothetical protein N9B82_06785 [Saprospiraceae bacterium]|nr:hypothetical protein [Saprospiraceae bacterium]